MKKFALILLALSLQLLAFSTPKAYAACTNSYGASVDCPTTGIDVNKKIVYPGNPNDIRDNLTRNDDKMYTPESIVEYVLEITNKSSNTMSTVTVTDVLPSYLTYRSGRGTYNQSTRTLTFTLENVKPNEPVTEHITAWVNNAASLPSTVSPLCEIDNSRTLTNYVKVVGPNGETDEDTASLCLALNVLGATSLPAAGFDDYKMVLPFALLALFATTSLFRLRKSI